MESPLPLTGSNARTENDKKMAREWFADVRRFLYFNYTYVFFYLLHSFFSLSLSLALFVIKKTIFLLWIHKIRRCEGKFSLRGFLVANSSLYYFFSSREFHVHETSLLSFCAQRSDAPVHLCLLFLEILRMCLLLVSLCA